VAGSLHPALAGTYFRVGHMGYATRSQELLMRTVAGVAAAIAGHGSESAKAASLAFENAWRHAEAPAATSSPASHL